VPVDQDDAVAVAGIVVGKLHARQPNRRLRRPSAR
jgi:hypothetical protein